MKPIRILHILFLIIFVQVYGQDPLAVHFNTENGLPSDEVYTCIVGNNQKLYIAHDLGLSIYDGRNFKTISPKNIPEGTSCYKIKQIGPCLCSYFSNNQLYFIEDEKFSPYKYNHLLNDLDLGVYYDFGFIGDTLFLSGKDDYATILPNGELIENQKKVSTIHVNTKHGFIQKHLNSSSDSIQIKVNGTTLKNIHAGTALIHFGISNYPHEYFFDNSSVFHIVDDELVEFKLPNPKNKNGLSNYIVSITQHDKFIYVSTRNDGLLIYENLKGRLVFKQRILENRYISIISVSDQGMWVPDIRDGIYFYPNRLIRNFKTDLKVRHVYPYQGNIFFNTLSFVPDGAIKAINSEFELSDIDTIPFSTIFKKELKSLYSNQDIESTFAIKAIKFENEIRVIPSPMFYFDENDDYYFQISDIFMNSYSKKSGLMDTIHLDRVRDCFKIKEGKYFVISKKGGHYIHLTKNGLDHEKIETLDLNIINTQRISNSEFFISSQTAIYKYDLKSNEFTDTLYNNSSKIIQSFYLIDSLLFIGSKKNLLIYDLKNQDSISLQRSNGILNGNISEIKSNEHSFILASEQGVSLVPYEVVRTKFQQEKGDYNQYINVDQEGDGIKVFFSYFSLNPLDKLSIESSLNGEEFQAHLTNQFNYSNLKSGNYKLLVRIRFGDGEWNYLDPIYFDIPLPYYQRWWFSVLIVSFIALIIILILRRRNKILTRKLRTEKLIETLRMNALTSQMNPHFLFNALNTIQGLLNQDRKVIFAYVSDLARFFRTILNNSSELYIPVSQELELNKIFVEIENVRHQNNVIYKLEFEEEELADIKIPSMLVQPFVENAMWHAFTKEIENPEISVKVKTVSDSVFKIEIVDNGIGIDSTRNRKKVHQSKGVSIVENRLKIFNSDNPEIKENIILTDRKTSGLKTSGTNVTMYLTKTNKYDLQSSDR